MWGDSLIMPSDCRHQRYTAWTTGQKATTTGTAIKAMTETRLRMASCPRPRTVVQPKSRWGQRLQERHRRLAQAAGCSCLAASAKRAVRRQQPRKSPDTSSAKLAPSNDASLAKLASRNDASRAKFGSPKDASCAKLTPPRESRPPELRLPREGRPVEPRIPREAGGAFKRNPHVEGNTICAENGTAFDFELGEPVFVAVRWRRPIRRSLVARWGEVGVGMSLDGLDEFAERFDFGVADGLTADDSVGDGGQFGRVVSDPGVDAHVGMLIVRRSIGQGSSPRSMGDGPIGVGGIVRSGRWADKRGGRGNVEWRISNVE